jgi:GH15 family glucan-1,4-alpha-glucosidase
MVITPAVTPDRALASLDAERSASFAAEEASVDRWWKNWTGTAALPDTTDPAVLQVAERALISMRLAVDPETGAIVASADTESPYGEDWIRDGAFINHALDVAGFASLVTRHDLFEASAQSSLEHPDPLAPFGNWPMNVYGDGTPGGPIPYEIDETGFGAFTLWDHFHYLAGLAATTYLRAVYPAIARAATWLSTCVDETNGFQCPANEDDSFTPSQTLHGAGPALLGLRSALAAAAVLGDTSPEVVLWQQRLTQLGSAVDNLYDPSVGAYTEQPGATSAAPVSFADGGWLLWPVQLHPYSDPRMVGESNAVWSAMLSSLKGDSGGYEGKALLGVCTAWSPLSTATKERLDGQLHYTATQLTTNTGLFGEWWQRFPARGGVRPMNDMPHIWEGALFYLSAMCVDGPRH